MLARTPGPPLSQLIHTLWLVDAPAPAHRRERVLPTGEMQVIIPLRPRTNALMVGARSEYGIMGTDIGPVMGVHFRPGGAYPFLRPPAGEMHNTVVALEDLWGAFAGELLDRVREAPDHAARLVILERSLLRLLRGPLERHPAVSFALRQFGSVPHVGTISSVTDQIGLSPRRFIEVFRDQVGLTPKVFCRLQRFHRAVRGIHGMHKVEWAGVAADGGYFDQAHFIHDFRAFSGISPSDYIAHRTGFVNHVVLPD